MEEEVEEGGEKRTAEGREQGEDERGG